MLSGKAAEYELFGLENKKRFRKSRNFLTKKWVDKVIDLSKVSSRMIVIGSSYYFSDLSFCPTMWFI